MKINSKLIILFIFLGVLSIDPSGVFAQVTLRERIRDRIKERVVQESVPKDQSNSIYVDGRERAYILHLPPGVNANKPSPLVIVLHGGLGNAENAMRMSGMNPKADKEGFIVVYPNGTGRLKERFLTWNTWNVSGYALENNVDDVKFLNTLIEKLEKEFNIDSSRIFATGISNGGMMSYRLACESSDKIAAIAPVAGALNSDNPTANQPVSVIAFHGTADEHVPYAGGMGSKAIGKGRTDKPVSYAINFWVKYNGCNAAPMREESGSIVKETYTGGRAGTEVALYTIKGGGHAWPGGVAGAGNGNVDPPTQEISATDIMWEFFRTHPKQK